MSFSFTFFLVLASAPIGTIQLPNLRGKSYNADSPAMPDLLRALGDDGDGALSLAQTDAYVKRPSRAMTRPSSSSASEDLDEDIATCDASCALAALARPAPIADSNTQGSDIDFLNAEKLQRALAAEINNSLADNRAGFAAGRTKQLEAQMAGLFAALPKNSRGGLGHAATNYAVHQWFVRQHQWYLRNDETQDNLSPGEALRARVPQQLQALLELQRGELGLGLRELSALVATIEHLIDGDLVERLKAAYVAAGLSADENTSDQDRVGDALLSLASGVVSLADRSGFGLVGEAASLDRQMVEETYPNWKDMEATVRDLLMSEAMLDGVITFAEAVDVARQVSRMFGDFLKKACMNTKAGFAAMPNGSTGRVSLAEMHRQVLKGNYQYGESTAYLKSHEMLDESNTSDVRVFVPNVLYGASNCVGGTSFLEVCCPNECEVLIQDLENGIAAPTASAAALASFINGNSLAANLEGGAVSPALLDRLTAVADQHGGKIPIHGRAFAEWLNSAFPLECPMPHESDFRGAPNSDAEVQNTIREFNVVAAEDIRASELELNNDALLSDSILPRGAASI
eukprot:TRINITY_DN13308_c0_g1_i1.p1 TRINITY_DN13308_c0_g1~~TRINITY_DN13308_c0_g1_i1.p1  ORF type:complete len:573 (-),score=108.66 TRINITY_DN13308_c0_g1_i1:56-1774(-)